MQSFNWLESKALLPDSVKAVLSHIYKRRSPHLPKIIDIGFDWSRQNFQLVYQFPGQIKSIVKSYNSFERFAQALGANQHEIKKLSLYMDSPEDYCFREDIEKDKALAKTLLPNLIKTMDEYLHFEITDYPTYKNQNQLKYEWIRKYSSPQTPLLPPDLETYISCMTDNVLVHCWVVPDNPVRLATLQDESGQVMAHSIIHTVNASHYHNTIYALQLNKKENELTYYLVGRMKAELNARKIQHIATYTDASIFPMKIAYETMCYSPSIDNDIIVFQEYMTPYIDNPERTMANFLKLNHDTFVTCSINEMEFVNFEPSGYTMPIPGFVKEEFLSTNYNLDNYRLWNELKTELRLFYESASKALASNPYWFTDQGLIFDTKYLVSADSFENICADLSLAQPQEILNKYAVKSPKYTEMVYEVTYGT